MADAALFEECLTGLKLPVAQEGDNAALEAAYTAKRREPGQPILATVDGRIALRPVMDGDGTVDTLVVERFDQLWPNESCGARGVTHELEGTRWVLTRLGDEVVTLNEGQRELSLALERSERRVAGYAGCNRLIGAYDHHSGQRINGGGFHNAADLDPAAPNPLPPTGAFGLQDDHILLNTAFAAAADVVPGSYQVHLPPGAGPDDWPNDHRRVSCTLRIRLSPLDASSPPPA